MKTLQAILTLSLILFILACNRNPIEIDQTVNAIIGDVSFFESYGNNSKSEITEDLRLKTHLQYVEKLLRNKDLSNLTSKQKEKRHQLLDLLNEYWKAGVFPRNYDFPDKRIPCFIDKNGRICAVGYLIEKTVNRQTAEEINSKFKYDYLLDMKDTTIDKWIQSSGLTKEECAMIQPAYGPAPTDNYISPEYGVSSALIGGLNLSLNTINGIQISKGTNKKAISILGLLTGVGQITLGALSYPEEKMVMNGTLINQSQRNLSLVNIGLGTSTVILSTWNLIVNKKPNKKSVSWNVYSYPTQDSNIGLGFSLSKRL